MDGLMYLQSLEVIKYNVETSEFEIRRLIAK